MNVSRRIGPGNIDASGQATFDYIDAFSRNVGWLTEWEQQELRGKTIAIAGLGGVGGVYLVTLARLGIGGFRIADFDAFELANFNRQEGARISTLGLPKAQVMADMARDINPELDIAVFSDGVREDNIDEFLSGADMFVDGFDFFVLDMRRRVFARCDALGIPAITAAPVGFGAAYVVFMPGGMTFDEYFRLEGLPPERQQVNMLLGVNPRGYHRPYLVDPYRVDFAGQRAPSTGMACQLCAGVVGTEALKILLDRGTVRPAPCYQVFDAYRGKWKRGWLPLGNRNPLQMLKLHIGYHVYSRFARESWPADAPAGEREVEQILDLARWAPSGDNAQPWRFEIVDDDNVVVRVRIEGPALNVYDFDGGLPTLLSAGFLLETMRIAASGFGRAMHWRHAGSDGQEHSIEAAFPVDETVPEDPLLPYIRIRSVERGPYRLRPLTRWQKDELERALGDGLAIHWHETRDVRWRVTRLNTLASDIRLRLRQAYEVHRRIIDWDSRFSPSGVPASAIGLNPLTRGLMRRAMRRWWCINLLNRLFGTLPARIEMDYLPGLACAAHFLVTAGDAADGPGGAEELLELGGRLQRFWLTATRLGLALQPNLAPICFNRYYETGEAARFGNAVMQRSKELNGMIRELLGDGARSLVFAGRLGVPRRASGLSRSVRRPLRELMQDGQKTSPG